MFESFAAFLLDHEVWKVLTYEDNQAVTTILNAIVSVNQATIAELWKLQALLNVFGGTIQAC